VHRHFEISEIACVFLNVNPKKCTGVDLKVHDLTGYWMQMVCHTLVYFMFIYRFFLECIGVDQEAGYQIN